MVHTKTLPLTAISGPTQSSTCFASKELFTPFLLLLWFPTGTANIVNKSFSAHIFTLTSPQNRISSSGVRFSANTHTHTQANKERCWCSIPETVENLFTFFNAFSWRRRQREKEEGKKEANDEDNIPRWVVSRQFFLPTNFASFCPNGLNLAVFCVWSTLPGVGKIVPR